MADKPKNEKVDCELGDGLELRADGFVRKKGNKIKKAKKSDLPDRTDLHPSHPFFGKKVVKNVPCGMPDATVSDDGKLVIVDENGDELLPESEI